MKTITLTESEIRTIEYYLWSNPCRSHCVHGYSRIDCHDTRENGEYKCELMRNTQSIIKKLGGI